MSVKFLPFGGRILIEVLKETISGSIILPELDHSDMPQRTGYVVALPRDNEVTSFLEVGNKVMFENMGVEVTLDGKDYKLIHKEYLQGLVL
jgi:co-chaperonin GroES (HSP10)